MNTIFDYKIIIYIIIIAVIISAGFYGWRTFNSTNSSTSPPTMPTNNNSNPFSNSSSFQDDELGISFNHPKDWVARTITPGTIVISKPLDGAGTSEPFKKVIIQSVTVNVNTDNFNTDPTYQEQSRENETSNGQEWTTVKFASSDSNLKEYGAILSTMSDGQNQYQIHTHYTTSSSEKVSAKALNTILQSFTVK